MKLQCLRAIKEGFGYKPLDTHISIFILKVSKSKY